MMPWLLSREGCGSAQSAPRRANPRLCESVVKNSKAKDPTAGAQNGQAGRASERQVVPSLALLALAAGADPSFVRQF